MFPLNDKSCRKIHTEIILRAEDFEKKRAQRMIQRKNLNDSEKEKLDKEFYLTFQEIMNTQSKKVNVLLGLLEKGATTNCFEDANSDSSKTLNFAELLSYKLKNESSLLAENPLLTDAIYICVEAGNAFITNGFSVGNGSDYTISLLLDILSGRLFYFNSKSLDKHKNYDFAEFLFIKIVILGGFQKEFWREFNNIMIKYFLINIENQGDNQQQGIAKLYFSRFINQPEESANMILQNISNEKFSNDLSLTDIFNAFYSNNCLFKELLKYGANSEGVFKHKSLSCKFENLLFTEYKSIIGIVIKSGISRKKFIRYLKHSKWLRTQIIKRQFLIFKFVRKKGIISAFLSCDANRLIKLRNEIGDDLLITLCKKRGKIEKILQIFLNYNFDPYLTNNHGKSALNVAQEMNNQNIVSQLEKWRSKINSKK